MNAYIVKTFQGKKTMQIQNTGNNNNNISGKRCFSALFIYCFLAVLIVNMMCSIYIWKIKTKSALMNEKESQNMLSCKRLTRSGSHQVQLRGSFPVHISKCSANYFNLTKILQHLKTIYKPLVRPYMPLVLQKVPVSIISLYFSHVG